MAEATDILRRLETLNEIGRALSSERDIRSLLERILEAAQGFANSDGGTLYLVENQQLVFEVIRNETLGYRLGGRSGGALSFPPVRLYDDEGKPVQGTVVAHAALTGETVNIEDAYRVEGYDFSGTRRFDEKNGYRSQSFLTVPMKNHGGAVIGVLQLINARSADGTVRAFTDEDQQLVESLASQAAIALNNRQLIGQMENLFESLINLINSAIDEKSPYTGGHCERVPVLTMMLAEATERTRVGPLADFRMNERDRYELKIAGLLHDCGKITTPVHVVDKATKLETLFDRIHLLETRWEVFYRDARIDLIEGRIDQEQYEARCRQLGKDFEMIRRSNIGGEFFEDEKVARVKEIANGRWTSHAGEERPALSEDEAQNLCIRRGTLNRKERDIINHHIVVTIDMLEALPWPAHLTRVPEFAGGHHERMDGKGYPKGLTRDQMSVQARVMGIADIFEALTAADRPYKTGKKLSEAIGILGRMKMDHHIDPDLFEVFLRERVYLRYAKRFLPPEQIDQIDWARIPGISAELARELSGEAG
ncbi:HD family phosphohydrolase [Pseudomarimonas salicorniae]|uniref:GAF domain-containing protein n=1 Tax=Pseudomarimonas salicorniae TaxID=2933270 RepID=A0ABT0GIG0_9GAMM|nr:HD family phosphohydrolase [Lysobacter sp. CAU 1642]MCK7594340.1 GAF domain-containing protein [Lysobacter sp. CAU 1642]